MNQFDIPVAIFMFKRKDTLLRIIEAVSTVKPQKLYLISDEGRNEKEKAEVADVRKAAEEAVNWNCNIVKYYAKENRGVYNNIAGGAKWVFSHEDKAIFLEDDNLPEITFFDYCKEMLNIYKDDERILWVCGTNYLSEFKNKNDDSYFFTQHLLPCGWASWSWKFNKFYDGEMANYGNPLYMDAFKASYKSKVLLNQRLRSLEGEYRRGKESTGFRSWDYQMLFSIRSNNLYGISPKYNQIRNIGADQFSSHGGTNLNMVMTRRFCEIPTKPLEFPLRHPTEVKIDNEYESKVANIVLLPLSLRIKGNAIRIIKRMLGIDPYMSIKTVLHK